MPDPVALIHGMRSRGKWFAFVRAILEPHFICRAIKHHHYSYSDLMTAPLSVALEPWVLLPSLIALIVLIARMGLGWATILVGGTGTLISFVLAHLAARIRYHLATDSVRRQLSRSSVELVPPHVVAHSIGSVLLASALDQDEELRVSQFVLVGSVLATDFDWGKLTARRGPSFACGLNEVGRRDRIASCVRSMRRMLPARLRRFGGAGVDGFQITDLVHDVKDPPTCSLQCASWFAPGAIHNLWFNWNHSDALENLPHQVAYWLPFLWGINVELYSQLRHLCECARRFSEERDADGLRDSEFAIGTLNADWSYGPVFAHLRQILRTYPQISMQGPTTIAGTTYMATRFFWKYMLRASELAINAAHNRHPASLNVLALRPQVCAAWACERAVNETLRLEA